MANSIIPIAQQPQSGIINPTRGVYIPKGSLDVWKAARNGSSSTRAEVVIFGDSTTYGQGPSPFYSWVTKLRNLSIAAGYPDGGRGWQNTGVLDTAALAAPDPVGVTAITGFGITSTYAAPIMMASLTASDAVTYQVVGTFARLWWTRSFQVGGTFSYSVNGGAAVVVLQSQQQPIAATGNSSYWSSDFIWLSGLTGGGFVNTVTVTNLGGNPALVPRNFNLGIQAGGSLSVGAHYYVFTRQETGGETGPSTVYTLNCTSGNQTLGGYLYSDGQGGSANIYRSDTSSSGPFNFVKSIAYSGGVYTQMADDGTVTPNASQHPPATNPTNLYDPAHTTVALGIDVLKATGVTYHNHGVPGIDTQGWFAVANDNIASAQFLGLQQGLSSSNTVAAYPAGTSYPANTPSEQLAPTLTANSRHPCLAISCLGINDVQHSIAPSDTENAIALFVRMARNAGADPLVIIPTLESCSNSRTASGNTRRAIGSMATAYNCAIVDFNEALGPVSTWAGKGYGGNGNPHLFTPAYDAEATFLWNNCLSL